MTPDYAIRAQIAAQIRLAAPNAIVWPRWVLGLDPADWPAVMRSSADGNRVHGYSVSRRSVPVTGEMSDHVSTDPRYVVVGVHYHLIGTDADNSEDRFKAEIDAIIQQFAAHDPMAPEIANHTELQISLEGFQNSGAELLHWMVADITLQTC